MLRTAGAFVVLLAYPNLSTGEAGKITSEVLDLQEDEIKLKKRCLERFRSVLSEIKTARFYPLERKLDAAENIELAKSVPLIWERAPAPL